MNLPGVHPALLMSLSALLGLTPAAAAEVRDQRWSKVDRLATEAQAQVIAWRRDFHQHPELGNREHRTARIVAEHLESLGLEVRTEVAHTGVVALLRGGRPGGVVALRADMDGLPVTEEVDLPYASKVRSVYNGREVGVMHACGHDAHVAVLMGAAQVLAAMRDELPGTVKLIFQPAEEGPPAGEEGGAALMIRQGVLDDPTPEAIFGLHITQGWEVGQAAFRSHGMMAGAERFDITVTGRQTHAAQPWAGVDPIVTAAQIVTALQTIVSRQLDATLAPAVLTVGTIHGGVRSNIIPDQVELSGTIRTFDSGMRRSLHERLRRTVRGIAESAGASATVTIHAGTPVTYNDPELTRKMTPTLERVYGRDSLLESVRVTGAEDFAFYQEQVPGFFFFIGGRPARLSRGEAIPNHSPHFHIDEGALVLGVRAMAALALDFLSP